MTYVELFSQTAFSFLRGVSTPEELVEAAHRLGYPKLGIADRNGLYGVVRAHRRAKELGLSLIVGAELAHDLGARAEGHDRPRLVLLAADRDGYRRLVRLLAKGRLAAGKGGFRLEPAALADVGGGGLFAIHVGALDPFLLAREREIFGERLSIGVTRARDPADELHLEAARSASARLQVPLVAIGAVRFHDKALKPLLDVLTCVRLGLRLDAAGRRLEKNAERVLLSPAAAARRFAGLEAAVARTAEIADACRFRLDELTHRFTSELIPAGMTATEYLRRLVDKGVVERYPSGPPDDVSRQLTHELSIIETLGYEGYFLTVWDIVRYARSRGILCQGRGSAANSIVCYVLGITSIDPVRMSLLFERFVSVERGEPPDIDVDFEHDRREEVMQYVYRKYGRDHAALVATVITYRSRSAFREVGKVFGLSLEQVDRLSALSGSLLVADESDATPDPDPNHAYSPTTRASRDDLVRAGLDPGSPAVAQTIRWARRLVGRPRHLGQHTGGFVISREPLLDIVPIENATMVDRTVLAWDKDDLDTLGFFKIDLLSLGMLSAIRRTFALVAAFERTELTLATVPAEDPKVYAMIADADTIGTFQVESRAQMQVLPKLAPKTFYDLVVSVAIIRPGPIQGDMVHPYLRRRRGEEPVEFPHPALESILGKTYGVPLFQEQVMKMAIAVAGFSGGEADELRRAIGWRSKIHIDRLRARLVSGMLARGITEAYAERVFRMIQGFGGYGFPESHAASFALIAYASCYLKRHHPAAFLAGLLNSQPMGFYSPNSLVKDAERHGLEVRPVSVLRSTFDATLEAPDATRQREWWRGRSALDGRTRHTPFADALAGDGRGLAIQPAVRLGLRAIRGMSEAVAARIVAARAVRPFASIADVVARAELPKDLAPALAEAGAFAELDPNRRRAMWRALSAEPKSLFAGLELAGLEALPLPEMVPAERLAADYRTTGLSVDGHPMQLLGGAARREGVLGFSDLARLPSGARVSVGGLVVTRQRPGTASGVVFITLEDEDGHMNLVVFPSVFDRYRRVATEAALLVAEGRVEHEHGVTNVIVDRLRPLPGASTEPKGRYHRFFRAM